MQGSQYSFQCLSSITQKGSFDAPHKYIMVFGSKDSGKRAVRLIANGDNSSKSIFQDLDNNNFTNSVCSVRTVKNQRFKESCVYTIQILQIQSQNKQYYQCFQQTLQIVLVCKADQKSSIQYILNVLAKINQYNDKIPKKLDILIIRTYEQKQTRRTTQVWETLYKNFCKNIKNCCPDRRISSLTMPNLHRKWSQLSQEQNQVQTMVLFQRMIGFRFKNSEKKKKMEQFEQYLIKKMKKEYLMAEQDEKKEQYIAVKIQGCQNEKQKKKKNLFNHGNRQEAEIDSINSVNKNLIKSASTQQRNGQHEEARKCGLREKIRRIFQN